MTLQRAGVLCKRCGGQVICVRPGDDPSCLQCGFEPARRGGLRLVGETLVDENNRTVEVLRRGRHGPMHFKDGKSLG